MKRITTILISFSLILVLAGCGTKHIGGTKSMVVLLPDLEGHVGQVAVATEGGQQVLTGANQSVQASGRKERPSEVTMLSESEIQSTFSEAMAAQPLPPARFILYFLQNTSQLTKESKTILPQIIQTIQERASADIVISGHTDTVGEKEYNYRLSLDRAKMMYGILVAKGADPSNITVTSHGEGNPLIKTADNVPEPRNRRVEVVVK